MKMMKQGVAALVGCLIVTVNAHAAMYTLSDLIDGNDIVTVGDKTFTDWGFAADGRLSASGVGVDITHDGSDYYVQFSGLFTARLGNSYNYGLTYSVATVSGQPLIVSIDQKYNLTAGGTGGSILIAESVFNAPLNSQYGQMVAQSSVGFSAGVSDSSDPAAEDGDRLDINPALSKVWVNTAIGLQSNAGGSVGATIFVQSFHQAVPDGGATVALLGFAMGGVALLRRFVRG